MGSTRLHAVWIQLTRRGDAAGAFNLDETLAQRQKLIVDGQKCLRHRLRGGDHEVYLCVGFAEEVEKCLEAASVDVSQELKPPVIPFAHTVRPVCPEHQRSCHPRDSHRFD